MRQKNNLNKILLLIFILIVNLSYAQYKFTTYSKIIYTWVERTETFEEDSYIADDQSIFWFSNGYTNFTHANIAVNQKWLVTNVKIEKDYINFTGLAKNLDEYTILIDLKNNYVKIIFDHRGEIYLVLHKILNIQINE